MNLQPQSLIYRLDCLLCFTLEGDKVKIMASMKVSFGMCRVLFSTITFRMGVDIANIQTVIHYGPSSSDIDDYI